MVINNILKMIVNVKIEKLLLFMYIPYMIINISNSSLFISAIFIHLLLVSVLYYSTYTTRQEIRNYIYKLKPIRLNIIDLKTIKKEIFTKAFNNKLTTAIIK